MKADTKKGMNRIPALKRCADALRAILEDPSADNLAAGRVAISELEEAENHSRLLYLERLAALGVGCLECGKKFLPSHTSDQSFCSIGCRYKGNTDDN